MAALATGANDWQPPAAILAAGEAARVTYRNGPIARDVPAQYRTPTKTQLPIGRGTQALRNAIVAQFRVPQTYMPGRARVMLAASMLDLHQAGRAIDFMVPGNKAMGDAVANHLVTIAEAAGIQFIVWSGNRWSAGMPRGRRWAAYGGSVKHRDHPHVELTPEGARGETPWFAGRTLPSELEVRLAAQGPTVPYSDAGSALDTSAKPLVIAAASVGAVAAIGAVVYWKRG